MRALFSSFVAFAFVGSVAYAQEIPPVYILDEYDDEDAETCMVSNKLLAAVVESELRHNRIPIGTLAQFYGTEAIRGYVNTLILENSGQCIVSYELSWDVYQPVTLQVSGKTNNWTVMLCQKTGTMVGPAHDMQSRLSSKFRDLTSACISEYLKK